MATNATIVQRLNELIDIKQGEEHGTTISQCLGILNGLESGSSDDSEQSSVNQGGSQGAENPDLTRAAEVTEASEPEAEADDEE